MAIKTLIIHAIHHLWFRLLLTLVFLKQINFTNQQNYIDFKERNTETTTTEYTDQELDYSTESSQGSEPSLTTLRIRTTAQKFKLFTLRIYLFYLKSFLDERGIHRKRNRIFL